MEKAEADETNGYNNLYKYTVPDNIKDPLVIFYGGDNSRRYGRYGAGNGSDRNDDL